MARRQPSPINATLAEYSARLGIRRGRLKMLAEAADALGEPELEVLRVLTKQAQATSLALEARRKLAAGLCKVIEELWTELPEDNPFGDVDEPLDTAQAAEAWLWSESRIRTNRARLLADCVNAAGAGDLTNRSRQAIEKQRREGNLVALRVGREWRYPKWQFDIDGPRGLVAGLGEVIAKLPLSSFGTAYWLSTPKDELGHKTPISALRKRKTQQVIRLAEEEGYSM